MCMSPFPSEASYCDNMTRLNPCFKKSGKKVKWIENRGNANPTNNRIKESFQHSSPSLQLMLSRALHPPVISFYRGVPRTMVCFQPNARSSTLISSKTFTFMGGLIQFHLVLSPPIAPTCTHLHRP